MLNKKIIVEAVSPISAVRAAFPQWAKGINSMVQLPSDGYSIYAANVCDVTLTVWENYINPDGTKHYLCHAHCW